MIPRATRAVVALATAAILWSGHPSAVWSHALLLESLPRPDDIVPPSLPRLVLRFNSRVEKLLSRISLLSSNGKRLSVRVLGEGAPDQVIAPLPTLAPGTYTVDWQVLSADGHLTRGSFSFRIVLAR